MVMISWKVQKPNIPHVLAQRTAKADTIVWGIKLNPEDILKYIGSPEVDVYLDYVQAKGFMPPQTDTDMEAMLLRMLRRASLFVPKEKVNVDYALEAGTLHNITNFLQTRSTPFRDQVLEEIRRRAVAKGDGVLGESELLKNAISCPPLPSPMDNPVVRGLSIRKVLRSPEPAQTPSSRSRPRSPTLPVVVDYVPSPRRVAAESLDSIDQATVQELVNSYYEKYPYMFNYPVEEEQQQQYPQGYGHEYGEGDYGAGVGGDEEYFENVDYEGEYHQNPQVAAYCKAFLDHLANCTGCTPSPYYDELMADSDGVDFNEQPHPCEEVESRFELVPLEGEDTSFLKEPLTCAEEAWLNEQLEEVEARGKDEATLRADRERDSHAFVMEECERFIAGLYASRDFEVDLLRFESNREFALSMSFKDELSRPQEQRHEYGQDILEFYPEYSNWDYPYGGEAHTCCGLRDFRSVLFAPLTVLQTGKGITVPDSEFLHSAHNALQLFRTEWDTSKDPVHASNKCTCYHPPGPVGLPPSLSHGTPQKVSPVADASSTVCTALSAPPEPVSKVSAPPGFKPEDSRAVRSVLDFTDSNVAKVVETKAEEPPKKVPKTEGPSSSKDQKPKDHVAVQPDTKKSVLPYPLGKVQFINTPSESKDFTALDKPSTPAWNFLPQSPLQKPFKLDEFPTLKEAATSSELKVHPEKVIRGPIPLFSVAARAPISLKPLACTPGKVLLTKSPTLILPKSPKLVASKLKPTPSPSAKTPVKLVARPRSRSKLPSRPSLSPNRPLLAPAKPKPKDEAVGQSQSQGSRKRIPSLMEIEVDRPSSSKRPALTPIPALADLPPIQEEKSVKPLVETPSQFFSTPLVGEKAPQAPEISSAAEPLELPKLAHLAENKVSEELWGRLSTPVPPCPVPATVKELLNPQTAPANRPRMMLFASGKTSEVATGRAARFRRMATASPDLKNV